MKKNIFVGFSASLLLLTLALLAAGLWVVRPETHRQGLEKAVSDALQARTTMGRIHWIWAQRSPGLELRSVEVASTPSASESAEPAFSVEKIRLAMDLPALLKKTLRVRSIRLDRPQLNLTRTVDGLAAALGDRRVADPRGASASWSSSVESPA